jgi:hypothetical protein
MHVFEMGTLQVGTPIGVDWMQHVSQVYKFSECSFYRFRNSDDGLEQVISALPRVASPATAGLVCHWLGRPPHSTLRKVKNDAPPRRCLPWLGQICGPNFLPTQKIGNPNAYWPRATEAGSVLDQSSHSLSFLFSIFSPFGHLQYGRAIDSQGHS